MQRGSFVKVITNANLLCLFSFVSAVSAFLFYSCRANYVFIDTAVFKGLAALLLALMLFVAVVLLVLYELRVHEVRRKDALLYEKKGFAALCVLALLASVGFLIGVLVNLITAGVETAPVIFRMARKSFPYFAAAVVIVFLVAIYPNIRKVGVKKTLVVLVAVGVVLSSFFTLVPLSPYKITSAPMVIDSGSDYYSVVFATNKTGTGYVEYTYNGEPVKLYDEAAGRIKGDSTIHTVRVPKAELDGNSYRVGSVRVLEAYSYGSRLGKEVKSESYAFSAPSGENQTWLSVSDWHTRLEKAYEAVSYAGDYDGVILLGDAVPGLMFEEEIREYIVEFGGNLCGGTVPVVYIRGNHETRGEYAEKLPDYLGMDSFYFTADYGDYRFIVLDSGEDKQDDHPEYGGMVNYAAYRQDMVDWLSNLPVSDKKTVALVHSGDICIEEDLHESAYASLKNLGVRQIISGHTHTCEFIEQEGLNIYIDGGHTGDGFVASKLTFSPDGLLLEAWNDSGDKVFEKTTEI